MPEQHTREQYTGSAFLTDAGPAGIVALLVGIVVLVLGIRVAARRGRRSHALGLFAASWLVVPLALFGRSFGEIAAMQEIVQLGPAVTPKDLAGGLRAAAAVTSCAMFGLLLGLAGATAALCRSREEPPTAA